eukprot:2605468-Rhodomonas_salina.1
MGQDAPSTGAEAQKRGSLVSAASAPVGQPHSQTRSNRQALAPPSPLPRVLVPRRRVSRYPGLASQPAPSSGLLPSAMSHDPHRPQPPTSSYPKRHYTTRSGLGGDPGPRAPTAARPSQTQLRVPVPPPTRAGQPARRAVQGSAGPVVGPTYVSFNPAALTATSLVVPIPPPDPRRREALERAMAARRGAQAENELPEPEPEPDVEEQLRRWLATFPTMST